MSFGLGIVEKVMLGTAMLGAAAGVIGCFAVLRRRALVGDMLAHAALPGVCLAFAILGHRGFLGLSVGALVTGLIGLAVLQILTRWTRTRADAAIAIVLSTFFGLGVVLLSWLQKQQNSAGLETYLFGQTAGMRTGDLQLLAVVLVVALVWVVLFYKEFKILTFDIDFARTQGWPTTLLDSMMMGLLAVVTVIGLPLVGVILMAAMLILPAAAARFWTQQLGTMLVLAGFLGAAAGLGGTLLASPLPTRWLGFDPLAFGNDANLPPGPVIVLTGSAFFACSLLFAPRQGIISRSVTRIRLRMRMAREHLLRAVLELSESQLPELAAVPRIDLANHRTWSRWELRWLLAWARRRGYLEIDRTNLRLTRVGLEQAIEVTRVHRLWEMFLSTKANIPVDHVHYGADRIEHLLPAEIVGELEREFTAAGTKPVEALPGSPHEIPGPEEGN